MTPLETFICLCPAAAAAAAHPQRLRQVLPARAHEHHTAIHVSICVQEGRPRPVCTLAPSALCALRYCARSPLLAGLRVPTAAAPESLPCSAGLSLGSGTKWWMLRVAQQVSGAPGAGTSPLRLQVAAQDAAS